MMEAVITSSVLILVIAALRTILQGKISLRLQYALWILVAVRLLCPFSMLTSPVSVMNAVSILSQSAENRVVSGEFIPAVTSTDAPVQIVQQEAAPELPSSRSVDTPDGLPSINMNTVLISGWMLGVFIVALCLAGSNRHFSKRLKKTAQLVPLPECPLPVYYAEGLPSPCLFGVIRPAIYLTPDCFESEQRLHHILAHELTHFRHKDHIWSLLRGVCIAIHWFNPLVWLAAVLSRRDCELACDEGTLKRLGDDSRLEYGRTLISMMNTRRSPMDLLCSATTMTSGKGGLKERIHFIAVKPKMLMITLAAVLLIAVTAVGCTFTGAAPDASEKKNSLTVQEAFKQLEGSLTYENGQLAFTLPAGYASVKQWNIQISGRSENDASGVSAHPLDEINEAKRWEGGKRYVILSGDTGSYTKLSLSAYLPGEHGQMLDLHVNLLPLITARSAVSAKPSFQLMKLGRGQEIAAMRSPLNGKDAELAEKIIMDYMIKSAAWPGVELSAIDESYLLRSTYPINKETHDYYAFMLDGKSVLQNGKDGLYSIIDTGLYDSLAELLKEGPHNLEASLSEAILTHNASGSQSGEFKTESHVILRSIENDNTATVYLMAYYAEYDFPDGTPQVVAGSHIPTVLTFAKDHEGSYTLEEYWQASDGSYYVPSIRGKFPADLAEQAMDTQLYVDRQQAACDEAARQYLLSRAPSRSPLKS